MATRTGTWDLNAASDGVTGYEASVDGVVASVVGPAVKTYKFSNLTNGAHTFTLVAVVAGNPPGEDRSDPATVTVIVTGKPSKPLTFVVA